MNTAKIDANNGEQFTIGTERATPILSIPENVKIRPRPGAKTPPNMKYQMAGVRKLSKGTKRKASAQVIRPVVISEMNDPVMALEVTKPRRMAMCDRAKNKAAWIEK
jgi:hypothetical protein